MIMAALKEMLDDISLAEDIIYSANPVLNSILKIKAAKAKENDIDAKIHTFIPKRVSIETGDMGVLYGNLLDNAIEACCRSAGCRCGALPEVGKWCVWITARKDAGFVRTL